MSIRFRHIEHIVRFFSPISCLPMREVYEKRTSSIEPAMTDKTAALRPATRLVHGGTVRTPFGETSEALFLTQGFVYDSAEAAEARFKGEEPGFIYARFSNPTVTDVRGAHGAARRRRGCPRDGLGHGGRHGIADGPGQGRRPCRRCEGAVRLLPLRRRGPAAALRRRLHPRRRRGSRPVARRPAPEHQDPVPGIADEPDARAGRHRGSRRDRARGRRDARRRQTSSRRRCCRAR